MRWRMFRNFSKSSRNWCEKMTSGATKTDNLSGLSFFSFLRRLFKAAFNTLQINLSSVIYISHIYHLYITYISDIYSMHR